MTSQGHFNLSLHATDAAGNTAAPVYFTWVYDSVPPAVCVNYSGCVTDRTSLIACAQPGLLHVFALCDALSSIVERAPCTVQWRTYTLVNSTANTCGALAVAAASSADWHSETVDRVWLAPDTDISSATDGHYMLMLRSIDSGGDVGATISVDWWIDGSPPPPPSTPPSAPWPPPPLSPALPSSSASSEAAAAAAAWAWVLAWRAALMMTTCASSPCLCWWRWW